jgi:hypothetical protein
MKTLKQLSGIALAVAALVAGPVAASAQVPVADAQAFLGQWALPLETPQGALEMTIHIENSDGNVAARLDAAAPMGAQAIQSVTKAGANLVLGYTIDFGGQGAPVTITLTPAGDNLSAVMSFADGQFTLNGTATRAPAGG